MMNTWVIVGVTALITAVIYTLIMVVGGQWLSKKLSDQYLFNALFLKFSTYQRRYAISKQIDVPIDKIQYIGNDTYFDTENEVEYRVNSYFGVYVYEVDKESGDLISREDDHYKFNAMSLRYMMEQEGLVETYDDDDDDEDE